MVPESELVGVKSELVSVQSEEARLESKLIGYQQIEEEIVILKCKLASLELEKVGFIDNISMLEHSV